MRKKHSTIRTQKNQFFEINEKWQVSDFEKPVFFFTRLWAFDSIKKRGSFVLIYLNIVNYFCNCTSVEKKLLQLLSWRIFPCSTQTKKTLYYLMPTSEISKTRGTLWISIKEELFLWEGWVKIHYNKIIKQLIPSLIAGEIHFTLA